MTVIQPNSISGVTSITAQGGGINVFRADGTVGDLVVNNINAGVSTFSGNVSIGGTLTYEDVTNIDSIGIVTARAGINLVGNDLNVGSNIKIGNASGIVTATSFSGSGANLTGIDPSAAASSSGFLKVLNASAPQIRLNNDASDGNTTRAFFGIATGNNNYINGSVANDTVLSARVAGDLLIGCGSTIRMRIDENGNVTKPNNFHILVDRSSNQTGYNASNIGDNIIWNRVLTSKSSTNASDHFNTSNGLFTAPVTGMYLFHVAVNCSYNVQGAWLNINGSRPGNTAFYPNGTQSADGMIAYHVTAGQTVGTKWYYNGQTNGTINSNSYHTWWRIVLLG